MPRSIKENKILLIALILGLAAALWLCLQRVRVELAGMDVCAVMTSSDITALAKAEGVTEEEYLASLRSAGLAGVLEDDYRSEALSLALCGEGYGVYDDKDGLTVGLVEDDAQYSFVPIEGYVYRGGAVRVFDLAPAYAAKYDAYGYHGGEEIVCILYRAVSERNIRVVLLRPMTSALTGETITDAAEYVHVLKALGERLSPLGLRLGDGYSAFEDNESSLLLLIVASWGVAAAGLALIAENIRLSKKLLAALLSLATLACAGLFLWRSVLAVALLALAAVIIFACLACGVVDHYLHRAGGAFVNGLLAASTALLCAIIGSAFVAALQSSGEYLLAVSNFRGVKLSQLLPLVYMAYLLIRRYYKNGGQLALPERRIVRLYAMAGFVLVALGVFVYILRTGNSGAAVTVAEVRFREALERILLIRPRSKEFLIAWPCCIIAAALIKRGRGELSWPFELFTAVGAASVINTFCHSRSWVLHSLVRSVYGLALGIVLGAVLFAVISLIPARKRNN